MKSIAVDVDGVVADQVPHVLARAEKEMGVKMTKTDITEWDTPVGGVPFDKLIAGYLLDPKFVLSMPVVRGAKSALDKIRREHKIIFASTRPVATEKQTKQWLHSVLRWVSEQDFVNTVATGKSGLETDFLIDDYIPNLRGFVLNHKGKRGILMSQPWNTNIDDVRDLTSRSRIIVLRSWHEVGGFFEELGRI